MWENNVRAIVNSCFLHSLTMERFLNWIKILKLDDSLPKSCDLIWQLSTTPVSHSLFPIRILPEAKFSTLSGFTAFISSPPRPFPEYSAILNVIKYSCSSRLLLKGDFAILNIISHNFVFGKFGKSQLVDKIKKNQLIAEESCSIFLRWFMRPHLPKCSFFAENHQGEHFQNH